MRVALTGHTRGIGASLAAHFISQGIEVRGFSRMNGYHLRRAVGRIARESEDCDVLINNAYFEFQQVHLLYRMFNLWHDRDKLIVNIGSTSPDAPKTAPWPYDIHKLALDQAHAQLSGIAGRCRLLNIRLGFVDTDFVRDFQVKKLNPEFVAARIFAAMNSMNSRCGTFTLEPAYAQTLA